VRIYQEHLRIWWRRGRGIAASEERTGSWPSCLSEPTSPSESAIRTAGLAHQWSVRAPYRLQSGGTCSVGLVEGAYPAKWHDLEWRSSRNYIARACPSVREGYPAKTARSCHRAAGPSGEGRAGPRLHYYTFTTDLTERKRAERRSGRVRTTAAGHASSEMASFDWTSSRTSASGRRRSPLFGTTPETFTGTAEEFFGHPPDDRMPRRPRSRKRSIQPSMSGVSRVWPDGSIHHIAARGRVHCDHEAGPSAGAVLESLAQADERRAPIGGAYRGMFESMLEGFASSKCFSTRSAPVDYASWRSIPRSKCKPAAHAQGKRMRNWRLSMSVLVRHLRRGCADGRTRAFCQRSEGAEPWYDVSAYRIGGPGSRKSGSYSRHHERKRRRLRCKPPCDFLPYSLQHVFRVLLVTDGGAWSSQTRHSATVSVLPMRRGPDGTVRAGSD